MSFSLKRIFRKSYAFRSLYWISVLNWFDLVAKRSRLPKRQREKTRVVFVKMDGIGDYVIWSAVFPDLKDMYPADKYERILVGNDRFEQLAENEPTFDEKIFLNLERFAVSPIYRYQMMKRVRALDGDIIINARSARDLLWSDSIVRCSAAAEKIGSEGTGNLMGPHQARLTRRWYTELRPAPVRGEHELVSNLKFLGLPENELSTTTEFGLATDLPGVPERYAVFFLGAQIREKSWPAKDFGLVAEAICKKHGLTAVLCGGPADRALVDGFTQATSLDSVDLVGKTTLLQLSGLLKAATLVVSNDTGAAHIAAMSGARTVVIASGNEVGRYFPYPAWARVRLRVIQYPELCIGCKESCVFSRWSETAKRPCIEKVSIADVANAAAELLNESSNGYQVRSKQV